MAFRERLQRIRHSFNELDPIERVIVAHSLFYEIPSPNYCFLRHALEERAQKDPKAVKMETEANDLGEGTEISVTEVKCWLLVITLKYASIFRTRTFQKGSTPLQHSHAVLSTVPLGCSNIAVKQ